MISLDRLANVLGGYGGTLCGSPLGRQVELRSVAVHDPAEAHGYAGDVLLAVGIRRPADALAAAANSRSTVVVVRVTPEAADLDTAAELGIAVLAVEPSMSFSQLAAVVYGLVLEGQETEAGRGPTDLFTLADTLARTVGGPVTVEDHLSRVLAYSSSQHGADRARTETILGRTVPGEIRDALAAAGVFDHLASSDEPLFVPPSTEARLHGRAVIALRAGRTLLGSIWVDTPEPLNEASRAALVEGSRTASLHMLRIRASADLERQVESDCVTRLLDGDTDTLALLGQLGLPHGTRPSFRVIAVRARTRETEQAGALLVFERATLGFGWARPGRSALFGNTVYTIMPGADDPAAARSWVADLVGALPGEVATTAGIGGPADVNELTTSRKEAEESLAVHALRAGSEKAVCYDESWDEILLERLRTSARAGREPARGPIAVLRGHDADSGTHFVPTLHAWLRAQGDLGEAATDLGVHRNTVRYRIRQMSELTDLGLDDPDRRLAMLIALTASRART